MHISVDGNFQDLTCISANGLLPITQSCITFPLLLKPVFILCLFTLHLF